jgi:hypothetical protein
MGSIHTQILGERLEVFFFSLVPGPNLIWYACVRMKEEEEGRGE